METFLFDVPFMSHGAKNSERYHWAQEADGCVCINANVSALSAYWSPWVSRVGTQVDVWVFGFFCYFTLTCCTTHHLPNLWFNWLISQSFGLLHNILGAAFLKVLNGSICMFQLWTCELQLLQFIPELKAAWKMQICVLSINWRSRPQTWLAEPAVDADPEMHTLIGVGNGCWHLVAGSSSCVRNASPTEAWPPSSLMLTFHWLPVCCVFIFCCFLNKKHSSTFAVFSFCLYFHFIPAET